jgi:hypothetical protein
MLYLTVTSFLKEFSRLQFEVERERMIIVTNHSRVVGGFIGPSELIRFQRIRATEQLGVDFIGRKRDEIE